MRLLHVAQVLVGEAVHPALEAPDQLLKRIEVATARLVDELDGREHLGAGKLAHAARIQGHLGMHQPELHAFRLQGFGESAVNLL